MCDNEIIPQINKDIGLDIMFSLYIFLFNNASPIYIDRNGDKYLYRYFLYVAKILIKNNVWYDFSADENTCETQQRYFFYIEDKSLDIDF
jgi:hypothetical protein